jgi:curli biogenesis system outer membrane secretion channel CsgG
VITSKPHPRIVAWLVVMAFLATTAGDTFAGDENKNRRSKRAEKKAAKVEAKSYTPGSEWEPYFKDAKGVTRKLQLPMEVNADKEWLGLLFTEYSGPKMRIAVMLAENKTAGVEQGINAVNETNLKKAVIVAFGGRSSVAEVPVGAIEELLTTSLFSSHRFDLIERKALGVMLAEQDFGESGRVAKPTAAAIGKVQGAQYLIFAAVNEWTPEKGKVGGTGGMFKKVVGIVAGGKSTAEVAMSFRIVDASSSEVLFAKTERATAGNWKIGLGGIGGGILGGVGMEKSSPISYAVQACINKGVYQLVTWLKDRAWTGSVMLVKPGKVYINAGSDSGLQTQMKLTVLSKGEELVDPGTGLVRGYVSEAIGSLLITTVERGYSVATIIEGCDGLKKGDQVKLNSGL